MTEPYTCTKCGAETTDLTVIDDETIVCESCLGDYTRCDECGEYYDAEVVDMHETSDGRTVCDNCVED